MADTVQQIKDRLSIVDVVGQYVKLQRSGTSLRARCPFHAEKTPSFFVSPERGTYHCFGCNVGGDIFSFVQAVEGLDFKGAMKVLADKAGIEIVYERGGKEKKDERERLFELMEAATIFYTSRLSPEALSYLRERGLAESTVQSFRLGLAGSGWSDLTEHLKGKKYTEKEMLDAGVVKKNERGSLMDKFRNRIIFPIADSAGRIVGFSGRSFGKDASPDAPKYLNSPETPLFHKSRILFAFDRAKATMRKHNFAILVEGQMDLLASHQAGWPNTVAASGTAFTHEHAQLLKRLADNVVLALDADEAGIKAAGKAARAALQGGLNVKVARLPQGLDPADFIRKEGGEKWREAIRKSKDVITFLLDVLEEHLKDTGKFRRAAETVVLPYLSDVQSPIERDAYLREVARRIGVSEAAVAESYARLPAPGRIPPQPRGRMEERDAPAEHFTRAKQAYSLLLWEASLPKPHLEVGEYEARLREAIGEEGYTLLEKLPKEDEEALRFSAEVLYGRSQVVRNEALSLIQTLARERLSRELQETTASLRMAEEDQNEAEIERLLVITRLLTTRIAELHEVR